MLLIFSSFQPGCRQGSNHSDTKLQPGLPLSSTHMAADTDGSADVATETTAASADAEDNSSQEPAPNESKQKNDNPVRISENTTSTASVKKTGQKNVPDLIIGINIGYMDIAFKPEGKSVRLLPEAEKALKQVKKDGFIHLRMMEPFARGFMPNFPNLPVQAIKLLKERGFKILLSINGSPFINGSDMEEKWVYRFFPGKDKKGKDDDGGLQEHRKRLTRFMDALKTEGLLEGMQFELFNEPNSDRYFWGSYNEFEQLLEVNREIILHPAYGIQEQDVFCCGFTSNLAKGPGDMKPGQESYWKFVTKYRSNALVNKLPFSFHWYPAGGIKKENYQATSSSIQLTDVLDGSWITEMNVTGYMNEKHLHGDGVNKGYRSLNTFREKTEDIIAFCKRKNIKGIYFFNLKSRVDSGNEKGRISTGLFNAAGCPRYEYKQLLELLNRPVDFGSCGVPGIKDF